MVALNCVGHHGFTIFINRFTPLSQVTESLMPTLAIVQYHSTNAKLVNDDYLFLSLNKSSKRMNK